MFLLLKDVQGFSAPRKELFSRLKSLNLPVPKGWETHRCILYVVRDLNGLKIGNGVIVTRKLSSLPEIYEVGAVQFGGYLPFLRLTVAGEKINLEVINPGQAADELKERLTKKISSCTAEVGSRELSEYIHLKLAPVFGGFLVARNLYVFPSSPRQQLEDAVKLINSYSPVLFLLCTFPSQYEFIVRRIKRKVFSVLNRQTRGEVPLILSSVQQLFEEGLPLAEEVKALEALAGG